ncbi:putative C-mannosyltransferase DPY19L3 [Dirofilaria immitis]
MDYEISKSLGRIPLSSYRALNKRQNVNLNGFMNYIGFIVVLLCGSIFGKYMQELHETKLWFSHIKQVEQEISLRTEAGFYYSYYKFAVHPQKSLNNVVYALMHDNSTEFPRQINVFQRFNIYQELILAVLYKFFASFRLLQDYCLPKPILFYVYSCFIFAGFGVITLFLLAWALTGSWLYGLLVFTWMLANIDDSTRVFFTVNLRENFALPFFWLQNACIVIVLRLSYIAYKKYYFIFFVSTFLFALFWQFNQFILLLQSISLVGMSLIMPHLSSTVISFLLLQSQAFFLVVFAQFGQPMNIASICTAFNLSSIVILHLTTETKRSRISMILLKSVYIVALTLSLSWFIRYLVGAEADTHIWTFVKAKIGLISKSSVPFETALYLCHGAFAYLDSDFFRRTSLNGCFPLFVIAILIVILMTLYSITLQCYDRESVPAFINHFGPETIFVVIQSVLCGIIAIFTLRMKYLWFPQISLVACILPVMISKYSGRFIVQAVVIATITTLLYSQYGIYKEQMANEQEFYDPDTVALMEWIMKSTESSTSWSGSMQLMAGIKACTGRYLANHPHFEDKWLRDRTLQLYQMYGRKTLEEMHEILTVHRVDYIILEDSICLAASTGCSTKDLVDVANGDTPEYVMPKKMDSKKLLVRFCDRLRYADDETKLYFNVRFYSIDCPKLQQFFGFLPVKQTTRYPSPIIIIRCSDDNSFILYRRIQIIVTNYDVTATAVDRMVNEAMSNENKINKDL